MLALGRRQGAGLKEKKQKGIQRAQQLGLTPERKEGKSR
jgi:hypothetical protein